MRIEIHLDCNTEPNTHGILLEWDDEEFEGNSIIELTAMYRDPEGKKDKDIRVHLKLSDLKKAIDKLAL